MTQEQYLDLQIKLELLRTELVYKEAEQKDLQRAVCGMKSDIAKVEKEILSAIVEKPSAKLGVTDHAIVRYLERVYNYNINFLKQEMLAAIDRETIRDEGDGTYMSRNGDFNVVVKSRSILTVTRNQKL